MVEVNSDHHKKPMNARRNTDSRVKLMDGDKYPEWSIWMKQVRKSVVEKKLMPLRYTWMIGVQIVKTLGENVMKLVIVTVSMGGKGRL